MLFFMVFQAILMQILKYRFCAFSSRELSYLKNYQKNKILGKTNIFWTLMNKISSEQLRKLE